MCMLLGDCQRIRGYTLFPCKEYETELFFWKRAPGPVWQLPKSELYAERYLLSGEEIEELKEKLDRELLKLLERDGRME